MVKNNEKLAQEIVEAVGGKNNIHSSTNCMTRVRMNVKDRSIIDEERLKNTEGVMGVNDADTYQVIVGPGTAKKINDILVEKFDISESSSNSSNWEQNKQEVKGQQPQGKFKQALATIANIFIPMIPAIIAAGIFKELVVYLAQ